MVMTTFLHDGELNQVLPDPNVQTLLDEVRKISGENWQIVAHPITVRTHFGFKTKTITLYGLYVYVGGMGPWQCINFYSSPEEFSINTMVPLSTIANFLMGICDGYRYKVRSKE